MSVQEIKEWVDIVTRATCTFDKLAITLSGCAECKNGTILIQCRDNQLYFSTSPHEPAVGSDLQHLLQFEYPKCKLLPLLTHFYSWVPCKQEVAENSTMAKKPGKKRGRVACEETKSAFMSATFLSTPIRWENVQKHDLENIVQFFFEE